MKARLHPEVERIGRTFKVVGMSTPATIAHKGSLLLQPVAPGERVGAVAADAVRCSSTIAMLIAAGAVAVLVHEKNGRGPTLDEAIRVAAQLGTPLVTAGELHGKPVPGGITGNSPLEAARADVRGCTVLFASTNFGAALAEMTAWSRTFADSGGDPCLAMLTFYNVDAIASWIGENRFDRIAIGLGGFYDVISLEDVLVAGDLIGRLDVETADLDDEARVMAAAARDIWPAARLAMLESNWIGRSLAHFGMAADLAAVLRGDGIPADVLQALRTMVPVIDFFDGIPIIRPVDVAHALVGVGNEAPAGGACAR